MKSLKGLGGMLIGAGVVALSISSASAADMRTPVVKAIPPAVVPVFSWTGFYVGAHLGAKRGRADFGTVRDVLFPGFVTLGGIPSIAPIVIVPSRFATIPGGSATNTSFVGGGQIGYNWQVNNFLLGLEADGSWNRIRAGVAFNIPDPFLTQTLTGSASAEIDWTASLRARVGVTFDRVLLYATGGAAFAGGRVNSSFTLTTPITGITFPIPSSGTTTASSNFSRVGWTLGGGFEWAFDRNWSLAGEYRYADFGSRGITLANTDPAGPGSLGIVPQSVGMRLRTDEATLRLNYRFNAGPGPVVASY